MLSNPFPAVLLGGPPHSGKSVLAYFLTRWLRSREVPHYVLRATPDGEGDWYQAGDTALVRRLRVKGSFTDALLHTIVATVQQRHLPLIVDAGGRPTLAQEAVFDVCTHAVLVAPDAAGLDQWRGRAESHGLLVMAELLSSLHGTEELFTKEPVLRARVVGLERQRQDLPQWLPALGERLACLFDYPDPILRQRHLATVTAQAQPGDIPMIVEVDRQLAPQLGPNAAGDWAPQQAPEVLAATPARRPLAVYGRGPGWLYSLLAVHALPARFYQYNVRLGWTRLPALHLAPAAGSATLPCTLSRVRAAGLPVGLPASWDATCLDVRLAGNFEDWLDIDGLSIPAVPAERGLILAGKSPNWLVSALARCYAPMVPWLAVYQPQALQPGGGAIVIAARAGSAQPNPPVGAVLPVTEAGD